MEPNNVSKKLLNIFALPKTKPEKSIVEESKDINNSEGTRTFNFTLIILLVNGSDSKLPSFSNFQY